MLSATEMLKDLNGILVGKNSSVPTLESELVVVDKPEDPLSIKRNGGTESATRKISDEKDVYEKSPQTDKPLKEISMIASSSKEETNKKHNSKRPIAIAVVVAVMIIGIILLLCTCDRNGFIDTSKDDGLASTDQTNQQNTTVHEHKVISGKWTTNETTHWKLCECGEKLNVENHSFKSWVVTKPATETLEGSRERECTVCKYKETAIVPLLSHVHSYSNAWNNNETAHWHSCECGEKSQLASHQYSSWDRYVNSAGTYGADTYGYNGCYTLQEITLDYQLTWQKNVGVDLYGPYVYNGNTYLKNIWIYKGATQIPAMTHQEYRYRQRTLQYSTEYDLVSWSEVTAGNGISNVRKYVKYRPK